MIARISGRVVEKYGQSLVVDVGGIGYEVLLAVPEFDRVSIEQTIELHTYHYIREQAQELFGFPTVSAKQLFELLLGVNGVGPRMALSIMSISGEEQIKQAIAGGDSTYIAQAAGVGKRIAERVVVDLRDKVGAGPLVEQGIVIGPGQDDAFSALVALGYSPMQASTVLAKVGEGQSVEERIKAALKELGK